MVERLHLDIETYSSEDLKKAGIYRYCESPDFEILMVAYSVDDGPVQIFCPAEGDPYPERFISMMEDPNIIKVAHNAAFERNCFRVIGINVPVDQWECTMVKAAYCGYPLSLGQAADAMGLQIQKDKSGTALINYFCKPIKPTKSNGGRVRNFWHHDLEKWEKFKSYCVIDVEVEKAIDDKLAYYELPEFEERLYILDQKINDKGVLIDLEYVSTIQEMDKVRVRELKKKMKETTGLENPNSVAQLKKWVEGAIGKDIEGLAKPYLKELQKELGPGTVSDVLDMRFRAAKSSIKKYQAMENCVCFDGRARGLFQFYGANRTGRWAGRLIQLQNLPQIKMENLSEVRSDVMSGDLDFIQEKYGDASDVFSQMIRPAIISEQGTTMSVADFSAIEARVLSWLADEDWRMEVFEGDGKIYEASASRMFGVPIEEVTKGSKWRQRGKVAELALGYQGSIGAMVQMGGERMGLTETEMKDIVDKWRAANPKIVKLWKVCENCAIAATVQLGKRIKLSAYKGLEFYHDGDILQIRLPSGKELFYVGAKITENKWGRPSLKYKNVDGKTKKWWYTDTYGGKLVENIVQAVSRDLLGYSMLRLDEEGFDLTMHVHDEAIADIKITEGRNVFAPHIDLERMCKIMAEPVPWAPGLPLNAEGYVSNYYKKD